MNTHWRQLRDHFSAAGIRCLWETPINDDCTLYGFAAPRGLLIVQAWKDYGLEVYCSETTPARMDDLIPWCVDDPGLLTSE